MFTACLSKAALVATATIFESLLLFSMFITNGGGCNNVDPPTYVTMVAAARHTFRRPGNPLTTFHA